MQRTMQEHARAYRAVMKRTDKRSREATYEYYGPYGSKGSAKARVTSQLKERSIYDKAGVHTGWVQAAPGHWENIDG